jgi:hypothetical protein
MPDEMSEASGFRFLFSSESPGRAVLEFETAYSDLPLRGATGSAGHGSEDRQREAELAISGQRTEIT